MNNVSLRDLERLSAYLDRELSQKEKTRLVARIVKEPELAKALDELRQTRNMLRQTPHRKAPRNFTLTPKMAGIRPPVPRVVPALSWASAVAMLMFVCTLGYNFLSVGGFGAAAPKASDLNASNQSVAATQPLATQPPAAMAATEAPVAPPGLGEAATETPAVETATPTLPSSSPKPRQTPTVSRSSQYGILPTAPTATQEAPTQEIAPTLAAGSGLAVASETPGIGSRSVLEQPTIESATGPSSLASTETQAAAKAFPWAYIWLGLAAVLVAAALLIRWLNRLAFARRTKG